MISKQLHGLKISLCWDVSRRGSCYVVEVPCGCWTFSSCESSKRYYRPLLGHVTLLRQNLAWSAGYFQPGRLYFATDSSWCMAQSINFVLVNRTGEKTLRQICLNQEDFQSSFCLFLFFTFSCIMSINLASRSSLDCLSCIRGLPH